MGFLGRLRRRAPEVRVEGRVEFLGEQDGPVEAEFKAAVIPELARRRDVREAYLARVGFQPVDTPAVALCVWSDRTDDQELVAAVLAIVHRMMARDVFLDILFVNHEQLADLGRVCRPFYVAAT